MAIIKAQAEQTYRSMGQVISQMVYDSMSRVQNPEKRNGVPLFEPRSCEGASREAAPNLELVNSLRDD